MSASQTGEPSPSRITSDLAAIPAGYDHPETPIPNNAASRTDEDGVVALHRGTRRCLPPWPLSGVTPKVRRKPEAIHR